MRLPLTTPSLNWKRSHCAMSTAFEMIEPRRNVLETETRLRRRRVVIPVMAGRGVRVRDPVRLRDAARHAERRKIRCRHESSHVLPAALPAACPAVRYIMF